VNNRVVLITGAGRRLGAVMARTLHEHGARVLIHYRNSAGDAEDLCADLNNTRSDSAACLQGDLNDLSSVKRLADAAKNVFGRIDGLINNASSFYPTPIGEVTIEHWDDLMGSNLRAPFFLSQALTPELAKNQGSIINMVDIHATRPIRDHAVYCAAKAGLQMLTMSLAKDLGPEIRVNGIAPGPVMWPENGMSQEDKDKIVNSTLLKRNGSPDDIAAAALYLMRDATFVTGQILAVDGGRSLRN